jgi:hypothetical protein
VFEADVRFYKEGDGRIVLEEFRRIQQASPTKAARLVAKLVDVALSEEPRWTAALDRYDVVDGEQVYLFTRDPYGVFTSSMRSMAGEDPIAAASWRCCSATSLGTMAESGTWCGHDCATSGSTRNLA